MQKYNPSLPLLFSKEGKKSRDHYSEDAADKRAEGRNKTYNRHHSCKDDKRIVPKGSTEKCPEIMGHRLSPPSSKRVSENKVHAEGDDNPKDRTTNRDYEKTSLQSSIPYFFIFR